MTPPKAKVVAKGMIKHGPSRVTRKMVKISGDGPISKYIPKTWVDADDPSNAAIIKSQQSKKWD